MRDHKKGFPVPDDDEIPIAFEIKRMSHLIRRSMNELGRRNGIDDVTAVHGWVIRYLYENQDRNVYQKDIEKDFTITKASVTNILKLMEEKGYITREQVQGDARLKRIILTDEGKRVHEVISNYLHYLDDMIDGFIGDEEKDNFRATLARLEAGLSEFLDN